MRKRRVFQLIKNLDRGGAEVLLAATVRAFDRSRYEFAVGYFQPGRNSLAKELCADGVDVQCFDAPGPSSMVSAVPRLARAIRAFRADLVHCHLPLVGVGGRVAASLCGVPVVYTEHNLLHTYHPVTRIAALATWKLQRHVIAVSKEVRASVEKHAGEAVPVTVVPNAVDVTQFQIDSDAGANVRSQFGVPDDALIIGTVAVFRPQKRLDLWLAAARRIVDAGHDARFLIVGFGPLEHDLTRWIAEQQLEDRVILAGPQTNVRPFLAAMDIYAMSSDFEGLPIALLEAMASGKPVVATAVGGIPEVIMGETTGFLVRPGSVDELAHAVGRLCEAEGLRRAVGRSAREEVERRFGISRYVNEVEAVYDSVLRGVSAS